jgi:micrococcal nuclease
MKLRSALIALILIAATASGCATAARSDGARDINFTTPMRATLDYAVDGDTLRIEQADNSYVRLVGIDTPEDVRPGYPTECGAQAAAASMARFAPEGATVLLRPDSVADATDRYGRILAHAFINRRPAKRA